MMTQEQAMNEIKAAKAENRSANLSGANLSGANLKDAYLRSADLRSAYLYGANLKDAYLYGADLRNANLRNANLRNANLSRAYLSYADLSGADLSGADLSGAALRSANLSGADLRSANLRSAYLYGANLKDAYLYGADLYGAALKDAKLPDFQIVPQEGGFIAYKKVSGGTILKLQILHSAQRTSSLVGRKCRASAVRVLAADTGAGWYTNEVKRVFQSEHDCNFTYTVGQISKVENFDDDIRVECTSGIHFFMTEKEAREY